MEYYKNLGFKEHPFVKTNADEEESLENYFVDPPFFDEILGDVESPTASVVFGPRGGGKTALRKMIEIHTHEHEIMTVLYDNFKVSDSTDLDKVSLENHISNIIEKILTELFLQCAENGKGKLEGLSKQYQEILLKFSDEYLNDLTKVKLEESISDLRGIPRKIEKFIEKLPYGKVITQALMEKAGLAEVEIREDDGGIKDQKLNQLKILQNIIVDELDYKSIYILIDKVDELELTSQDIEKSWKLIRSMLLELKFLELQNFGMKFFLWDKLEDHFREECRSDRINKQNLSWSREDIEKMLEERISYFSEGKYRSLNDLFPSEVLEDSEFNPQMIVSVLSEGSPRNAIRICEKIISHQANMDSESDYLTLEALNEATLEICEIIVKELYTEEICNEIKKAGQEIITITYLTNEIFKEHQNTCRNKVKQWLNKGAVKPMDKIYTQSSSKPVNSYYVANNMLIRWICSNEKITDFFKNRWIKCENCGRDNLYELNILDSENELQCLNCTQPTIS